MCRCYLYLGKQMSMLIWMHTMILSLFYLLPKLMVSFVL